MNGLTKILTLSVLFTLACSGKAKSLAATAPHPQANITAQKTDEAEIAKYVHDLISPDEKVRYDAVYGLGEAGAAAARTWTRERGLGPRP